MITSITPGTIARWGPERMCFTPSPIIVPQDGSGAFTPTPRKPSAASSRIAFATISGRNTITVEDRFGMISDTMIRHGVAP